MLWFYVPLRDRERSDCREVAALHSDHFQQVSLHVRNVHTYIYIYVRMNTDHDKWYSYFQQRFVGQAGMRLPLVACKHTTKIMLQ